MTLTDRDSSNDRFFDALPPQLRERARMVGEPPIAPDGRFVLYWMRCAIRVDENPALQIAICLANQLGLPVLVYQGLSERYPFASDRHHTFVLQGARDVQSAFASRKIRYLLHVERPGHRGPHLKTIAKQAAMVVTEDMPTEPLRSWTARLSRSVPCGVLAVDTACVLPMRAVGKSYERAFAFRDATKHRYQERILLPASDDVDMPETDFPPSLDLPFDSVDLQQVDIADLVADCEIDHSIGPVPETVGGSVAGYCRWESFQETGLASYDRRRNDALIDGVSRLSAYLHYGMVAPTRIAREAAQHGSQGAEKFLDELLVWRELAYVFCHYRPDHGRLSAIPPWARQTLCEHRHDPRELISWERLARGRTGDSLWDSAQRSLLVHGELHNNVRMTWGKTILAWTADAKQALARIIDLNHRYALDGRDPASYGGILWCLGQFDRPFSPPQPIFGSIRTRSTRQHAKRLDPDAYRRKATRSLWSSTPRIAIVGSAISGLVCGRTLLDHGCDVEVFNQDADVPQAPDTDQANCLFHARDKRFKRYVQSWIADGLVRRRGDDGKDQPIAAGQIKNKPYAASLGAISKHLAADLTIRHDHHASALKLVGDQWRLLDHQESGPGSYDVVVLNGRSDQADKLLKMFFAEKAAADVSSGIQGSFFDAETGLGVCGDRATLEENFLGGMSMAGRILGVFSTRGPDHRPVAHQLSFL